MTVLVPILSLLALGIVLEARRFEAYLQHAVHLLIERSFLFLCGCAYVTYRTARAIPAAVAFVIVPEALKLKVYL